MIPDEEKEQIKSEWLLQKQKAREKQIDVKLSQKADTVAKRIDPTRKTGVDRSIQFIVISVILYLVYQIMEAVDTVRFAIEFSNYSAPMAITIAPVLLLPFALYFLVKRDEMGWIILVAWAIFNLITVLNNLYIFIQWRGEQYYFPKPSPYPILVGFLVFSCYLFALNTRTMLAEMKISRDKSIRIAVISVVFSIGLIYLVF